MSRLQSVSYSANENFPSMAVSALRTAGQDVVWIRTDAPGSRDADVLKRAQAEDRIVVTFDKDFGELAFRSKLPATCGIILFRISMSSPDYVARAAVAALDSQTDWAGNFAVIEDRRIRVTPLPK
jgi:predicted nuclease of predicted toxin-antitoxin system